jgi:hypothetical protein
MSAPSSAPLLRPLSVGEVLDAGFRLLRRRFGTLVGATLLAGTHVVRDRHGDRTRPGPPAFDELQDPGEAADWDVSAISGEDVTTVRAFLERREQLAGHPRNALAADLAGRLRPRVGGSHERLADEQFLELLAAAKAARS